MELLAKALKNLTSYRDLLAGMKADQAVAIAGLGQIHRSHFIASAVLETGRPGVVICQDDMSASRTAQEISAFLGKEVAVCPNRDLTLYDAAAVSRSWEQARLSLLYKMATGTADVVVFSLESFAIRTMPKAVLLESILDFQAGKTYDLNELPRNLERNGYARTTLVEGVGQFALRGGILDVFSPAYPQPLRVEFFGDDLDIMGFFDVSTQRRTENVENAVILPVAETQPRLHPQGMEGLCNDIEKLLAKQKRRKNINEQLIRTLEQDLTLLRNNVSFAASDRYMALIYPQLTCANDYVSRETLVFFNDFGNLVRHEKTRVEQQGLMLDGLLGGGQVVGELCDFSMDLDSVFTTLKGKSVTYMDNFLATRYPEILPPKVLLSATAKQLPSYGGSLETAAEDLRHYQKNDFGTLVLCGNRRRGELLLDMLREKGLSAFASFQGKTLPAQGQILLVEGNIPAGMEYPDIHLAVLSEGQILQTAPRKTQKNSKKAATNRKKLSSFTDLSPGDLVVHERYGIGRFVAIEPIRLDGVTRDYVKVAYGGSDVLYVPATQLDVVSKYIGGGEDAPVKLNRLSGDQWQKTKAKARAAAKDMAAGLIKLYAQRQKIMGYPFAADTPWQAEFEESFPFAETDDQLRCIADIKSDMESHLPMDRLLCGDVGFGKTEVALRAAMKAILDGKQVALLVPTTVLAQQHFLTAKKRFSGFPVNITVISRFSTPKQVKNILFELKSGKTDMLIGTHKLLQKDVIFKDMGLLIVDEEQRFGVSHKERLKEISVGVDVLTLSATPIPRTLNMALSGIRDMSTIEEPPQDRHPVQTFVLEHNDMLLDDAIGRELSRGGQVYYLHNRVESIEACAAALKKRLPNATIGVAHGKLTEAQLSQVMEDMNSGDVQILVCTTIIETGIDISNVNTLIIENADRFGLSQLHQLRGRVGRSNRHAFCYLTYKKGKVLTEVADKRLSAIRDFAEFGSGFKIAMRDLEIRGAGDLLGAEQSGHLMSVGYDMYLKLLEEAVVEERGDVRPVEPSCSADLVVSANIPKEFVASGEQRMDLYRRMAAIRTQEDGDELLDEIVDRFGDLPKSVMNLISVALLRAQAAQTGIVEIAQKQSEILFTMDNLNFGALSALGMEEEFGKRILFVSGTKPAIRYKMLKGENPLKVAQRIVERYEFLVNTADK